MNDEQIQTVTALLTELLGHTFALETTDDTLSCETHDRSVFEQVRDVFNVVADAVEGVGVLIYEPDVEDGIGWTVTLTVGRPAVW